MLVVIYSKFSENINKNSSKVSNTELIHIFAPIFF